MDKELLDLLVNLKIDAKSYTTIVDTILDNCALAYDGDTLRIDSERSILAVVKALAPDKYNNRLNELKEEDKRIRAENERKAKEERIRAELEKKVKEEA